MAQNCKNYLVSVSPISTHLGSAKNRCRAATCKGLGTRGKTSAFFSGFCTCCLPDPSLARAALETRSIPPPEAQTRGAAVSFPAPAFGRVRATQERTEARGPRGRGRWRRFPAERCPLVAALGPAEADTAWSRAGLRSTGLPKKGARA